MSDERQQCRGEKADGERCTRKESPDPDVADGYCKTHQWQAAADVVSLAEKRKGLENGEVVDKVEALRLCSRVIRCEETEMKSVGGAKSEERPADIAERRKWVELLTKIQGWVEPEEQQTDRRHTVFYVPDDGRG